MGLYIIKDRDRGSCILYLYYTKGEKMEGTKTKKYRTLKWEDRLKMEALYNAGLSPKEIAEQLGFHFVTIYRELKRGKTQKRNTDWTESTIYSPDLSQQKAEENKKLKGRKLKIGNDYAFADYVEDKIINEKYSPAAVLAIIKREEKEFETTICLTTLYNYIKKGVFLNVTMAECPYHKKAKKQRKRKVQKRVNAGTSIDERPKIVDSREEAGHWEMDTVVGGQGKGKKSFLVLTERKTRFEIVEIMKEHTAAEVVRILDKLERKLTEKGFRETFKTITVDNGTEFSDAEGIMRSRRNKQNRTELFYCHAYRSSERATNENNNRFVRRWWPKGENLDPVSNTEAKRITDWMNDYPRGLFDYKSSADMIRGEPLSIYL